MKHIIGVLLITFLLSGFARGPEPEATEPGSTYIFQNKRKKADQHFDNFEYEPAIKLYSKLVHKRKADDMVKLKLAESYLKIDDFINAEKWYAEVINSEQVTPNHQIQYAQALLTNGKYDEAREVIGTYEFAESDYRSQVIINTLDQLEGPFSENEDYEDAIELSTIHALIIDENNEALGNTSLKVIMNGKETETTLSDRYGKVLLHISPYEEYTILAVKQGFEERAITLSAESLGQQEDLLIVMNPIQGNDEGLYETLPAENTIAGIDTPFAEPESYFVNGQPNQMNLVETIVVDAITGERLNRADLKLFVDSPNQELEYEITDGVLIFEAKPEEDYIIVASHSDYQDRYITLSGDELLTNKSEKISLELEHIQHLEKDHHGKLSTRFNALVRDEESKEQLENAEVKFFVDGKAIESELSKENGKTVFKAPQGNDYMMLVSLSGYQDLIYHLPGVPQENMDVDLALLREPESGPNTFYRRLAIKGYAIDEFSGMDLDGVTFKVFENGDPIETTQFLSSLQVDPDRIYQVIATKDGYAESLNTINPSQFKGDDPVSLPFALKEENISEATGNPVYQEIEGDAVPVSVSIVDITDDQPVSEAQVLVFADNQVQEKASSWQSGIVTINTLTGKDYQLLVKRTGYNDRIIDLGQIDGTDELKIALIPQNIQKLRSSGIDLTNASILVMAGPNGEDQSYLSTRDALYQYEVENDHHYLINKDRKILLKERNRNHNLVDNQGAESREDFNKILSENNVAVSKIFNINSIYYDFDKVNIREDAAVELDKMAAILSSNKNIKVTMLSHTDSRGSTQYNNDLSDRRGMAAVQYLVDRGIDIERLTIEAKGETRLINSCTNSVKCSEEAHQLNRRTEFILSL